MDYTFGALFFIFGAILGSFINVISVRYNTGFGISGRSRCFSCFKTLHFFELIPIFSFIFLRGKCLKCKSKISIQDFVSEVLMAFFSLLLFLKFGLSVETFFFILIFGLLLIITTYDLKHKIIPDGAVFLLTTFSFLYLFLNIRGMTFYIPNLYDFMSGFIVASPLFFLWLISNGKWIGLGDSKLLVSIGFLLGVPKGFSALVIAFWVGAIFSLFFIFLNKILKGKRLNLKQKQLTMKSEIPFAPFIVVGFLIVFFFGFNLFLI